MVMNALYTIYEKQNRWSTREPSLHFECSSLTAAKRKATREQAFHGTVLEVWYNGNCVAYKENGRWVNCE